MVDDAPLEDVESMDNWGEALEVTATGLAVVFGVMGIIAASTWASGLVFVGLEKRAKAKRKAEKATRKAEKAEKAGKAEKPGKAKQQAEAGKDGYNDRPAEVETPKAKGDKDHDEADDDKAPTEGGA